MSFLAIDIGNSNVTVGLHREGFWREQWRFSSRTQTSLAEWQHLLMNALHTGGIADEIESCAIASVVPDLSGPVAQAAQAATNRAPLIIETTHFDSLSVTYKPRSSIGLDRFCGVAAGLKKFGAPLIVIDLGTATVFDVVDEHRVYRGGVIAPGLATAADSLHANTALLPNISLEFPPCVIGDSTVHAMQSGILYGALTMIDGIVNLIRSEVGAANKVVATGGFASMIQSGSRTIDAVEPNLVLEGIRIVGMGETW
ncbi:type III pantothenate kinase [bacterium]|nr:type III pantothenate kinase [bacterium]